MQLYGQYTKDYVTDEGVKKQTVQIQAIVLENLHKFIKQHYPDKLSIVSKKFKSYLNEDGVLETMLSANRSKYDGDFVTCQFGGVHSQCGMVIFEKWSGTIYEGFEDLVTAHIAAAESIAKECLGYSASMVTLVSGQIIKQLKLNGYKTIDTFHNSRSGNEVSILMKHL